MNPDLERLIELEKVDAEISRLKEEISALPKRVAAIEAQLAEVRSQVEKEKAAIKEYEATRRRLEGEIQAQQQKISKFRDQSLDVKTNDQYKALMHEIQFAEQGIRTAEDQILETMVGTETQEKLLKAAEIEMKKETVEVEQEKEQARCKTAEDETLLAEWTGKRDKIRPQVDSSALGQYDRVMRLRHSAVAEARAQKCTACNVMLRPQKFNEIRTNEQLHFCDSCGRILWFDASRPEEDPKKSSNGDTAQKAWYFMQDWKDQEGAGHPVFIAFVNQRNLSSHHVFDAATGLLLDKRTGGKGSTYKEIFRDEIDHGRLVHVETQPHLDDCDPGLPSDVLEELRSQIPSFSSSEATATH